MAATEFITEEKALTAQAQGREEGASFFS